MRLPIRTLAGVCALVAGHAQAEWIVFVDDPDVFGNKPVFATNINGVGSLVIRCDAEELKLAYAEKKQEFEKIPETPTKMLVQVDGGTPQTLDATTGSWNDNYAGVIVDGRNIDTVSVLTAIKSAKKSIRIGVVAHGKRLTASFDAAKSEAAMNSVIKNCNLEEIKAHKP